MKKKINLKEFKQDQLQVAKLLTTKGGVSIAIDSIDGDCDNGSGTTRCKTRTCGGDQDYKNCDTD